MLTNLQTVHRFLSGEPGRSRNLRSTEGRLLSFGVPIARRKPRPPETERVEMVIVVRRYANHAPTLRHIEMVRREASDLSNVERL